MPRCSGAQEDLGDSWTCSEVCGFQTHTDRLRTKPGHHDQSPGPALCSMVRLANLGPRGSRLGGQLLLGLGMWAGQRGLSQEHGDGPRVLQ